MQKINWTNKSVLDFSEGMDPIKAMEQKAQEYALSAIDEGWEGPPYDPIKLAKNLNMSVNARTDIPDARTVSLDNEVVLEFNPLRPRGRVRFSIAHEIAHTMFEDFHREERHRGGHTATAADNWQLEILCNIGAAELLMPMGSFAEFEKKTPSIDTILKLRKEFDVSVEACMIRMVKLAKKGCAAFCATDHGDGDYKIDYVIPTVGFNCPIKPGFQVPKSSVVNQVNAIGYTVKDQEIWENGEAFSIECVGLAPLPNSQSPRVVGLLMEFDKTDYESLSIKELFGDALKPVGNGHKIIAHVIPNTRHRWGGRGFASQVRVQFPEIWDQFQSVTSAVGLTPELGQVYDGMCEDNTMFMHMVAQKGIRTTKGTPIQYEHLSKCLAKVAEVAKEHNSSIHMPRIGTGHGGGNWQVIKELISQHFLSSGIQTTIYTYQG